jgi:hypothetical protein
MNSKQLAIKLMHQLAQEYSLSDNVTLEQLDLAVTLAQSFETGQEKTERKQKFTQSVNKAVNDAKKYA